MSDNVTPFPGVDPAEVTGAEPYEPDTKLLEYAEEIVRKIRTGEVVGIFAVTCRPTYDTGHYIAGIYSPPMVLGQFELLKQVLIDAALDPDNDVVDE